MENLLTRPYRDDDAVALTDLFNEIERHAGGDPGYTSSETHAFVTTIVRDVATDTRMLVAPDGALVAAALVPTPPEGGFRVDLAGGVRPAWRGRGIGRALLGWQLSRSEEIRQATAPDAAWEAHVGAVAGDDDTRRLCARFGLDPVRYFFEMQASLDATNGAGVPDGFAVTSYQVQHEKDVYEAHMEAFQDHWGYQRRAFDEWSALTVRSPGFLPEHSLLAFDGAEIAGYVLCYHDADPSRLYVGHVGVRRPWRRRGLAGGLLSRVLADAREVGYRTATLGVDADSPTGAVGVYERVGFHVAHRGLAYSIALPVGGSTAPAA
ncbi:MAG TPA: GNAT family N-acetyltransferase [Micromonosporaceae bacterium]